ncbi:MAG: class II glutamine amidotransferase [bacterium]
MPKSVLETALNRHPDGYGVAWREPGVGLQVEKFGPQDRKAFRALIRKLDQRKGLEYVCHFRQATHGPVAQSHAHPYEYTDPKYGRVLVFHNGIVSVTTKQGESDTEVFTRDILAHLPSGWWRNIAMLDLVSLAGGWSRFVVMTETETINIDESSGTWDGGLWYSSNHLPSSSYGKDYTPYATRRDQPVDDYEIDWVNYRLEHGAQPTAPSADTTHDSGQGYLWAGRTEMVDNQPHKVVAITAIRAGDDSPGGDYEDAVICETCESIGSVFVVDGIVYNDLIHHTAVGDSLEESSVTAVMAVPQEQSALINAAAGRN